jgi:hypothetical protein
VQHNFVVVAPPTVLSSADWEAEHRQLQIEDQSLLLQEQVRNRTKNLSRVGDRGHRVRTCPAARCRQAVEAGPATGGFAHTQRRHAGPPRHRVSGRAGELRGFRIAGRTASLRPSPCRVEGARPEPRKWPLDGVPESARSSAICRAAPTSSGTCRAMCAGMRRYAPRGQAILLTTAIRPARSMTWSRRSESIHNSIHRIGPKLGVRKDDNPMIEPGYLA